MGKWKQELEEILKEETDMGRDMIPKYARCYARIILENFISQEIEKAREEVERKFVEKYHKRGEEMNVPYSEEDGKEFWQGYKEGYNQGLKDMIVDTYYLDKEFELKLKDNK